MKWNWWGIISSFAFVLWVFVVGYLWVTGQVLTFSPRTPEVSISVEWDVNTYFEDDPGPPTGWSADHWECYKVNMALKDEIGRLNGSVWMYKMMVWCEVADSIDFYKNTIDSLEKKLKK